jgi:Zn-dependent protease
MISYQRGSFHLFRFAGVDVFLHWSWFLVAAYEISDRAHAYSSISWPVIEYLALFAIVLTHEYGHALACKQVGGTANRIMLWPLGGVAYVLPPQRPTAVLWSIAAGPLVNVALFVLLSIVNAAVFAAGWATAMPDAYHLLKAIGLINLILLIFNLLPIYPLDGGQILRALLWFPLGRIRSLMVATIIGFVGAAGLILLALVMQSPWTAILAVFMIFSCWGGLQQALAISRALKAPRRPGYACPDCKTDPPAGAFWVCGKCRKRFDTFATQAVCPYCAARFETTMCLNCGRLHPMSEWIVPAPANA